MDDRDDLEEGQKEQDFSAVRRLSWSDLGIVFLGIIFVYGFLGLLTFWASSRWPHEQALLYANGFATQLAFILLIWSLKKARHWTLGDFGWKPIKMRSIWRSIFSLYALTWLANLVYALIVYRYGITPSQTDVYSQLFGHVTPLTLLLNVLLAGVLAPMVEETLFRGIIFGSLQSYFGKWTAATLSALLFSGLHLQAIGFIPRFVLGMVLAHLYFKNKSIYPSMAFHSLNNLVATLLAVGISQ
ncbi:MAG: CPBP family intramembrane glutamic endopeptidase [Desulfitobacteriaceae bacterium]